MLTKKIALSDDVGLVATMKDSFFQREGFGLVMVQNAQEGYEAVVKEAPALAIFDLAMMGDEGIECCRKVKSDTLLSATPVLLVLPDKAADELADRCWDAGSDAVVHRPIDATRLLDAACRLLGISRRLERRFPVSFQLEFAAPGQQKHLGTAVNLNAGGMFLATETLYPVDTRVVLEFTLPGHKTPLGCSVRVAWVNHPEWVKKNELPAGIGVEFVDLNPTAKIAIKEFLDSHVARK